MLTYYRGHAILLLVDELFTAEATELSTGAPLPTKVSATRAEGAEECLARAKALIDAYIDGKADAARSVKLLRRGWQQEH